MNPEYITLVSIGYPGKKMPELIAHDVEVEFQLPVSIKEGFLDLEEFYDSVRGQYNGNMLLRRVDEVFSSDNSKTLAVFNVDLFIPILTFIFGQAFLNGASGISSLHRLRNERYGLPVNNNVLLDRLRKEVIHELGHTFGLIHCFDPVCVMRSSTYVEDIDQKSHKLCQKCKNELMQMQRT